VFDLQEDSLRITLRDQGPEFDPLSYEMAEVDAASAMPSEAGGHGIRIARLVMDDVCYAREAGWNVLRMTKGVRVIANT
jgi:anti-sigma regulatory factor (Ser/Thr protein kinase)